MGLRLACSDTSNEVHSKKCYQRYTIQKYKKNKRRIIFTNKNTKKKKKHTNYFLYD